MSIRLFFCLITFLFVRAKCNCEEVIFEQGRLLGKAFLSRNGTEYYGFLSIPFAEPPIGELRFQPPKPPAPWQSIRNATTLPPVCIQEIPSAGDGNRKRIIIGQEDCLYLNVFTPKKRIQHLPVMVFIHGGSFLMGSSLLYDPSYFMDHQIIIVTIHYRLGLLGFLSTGDHVLPGNNGMKDQVMALKWVQKNIAAFGGDPNKVTLFGESAGAGSVHYHMHSSLSKGLFYQAISQSGTSLAPWAHNSRELAQQKATAVGIVMGCPQKCSKAFVKCLRQIPAKDFVAAVDKFYIFESEPATHFPVVVEPDLEGAFITESTWYHKATNEVPWIVGINSADGAIQTIRHLKNDGYMLKLLSKDYHRVLPVILFYKFWIEDEDKISNITESLKNFYFGNESISFKTPSKLIAFHTDAYFAHDAIEAAKRHNNTVYFYYYDHRNERTFSEVFGKCSIDLGVTHADELFSFFYLNGLFPKVTKGNDFKVSERMVNYWVNFATTGNPNNNDAKQLWTPILSDDFEYLHITTEIDEMKKELLKERYLFWKSLQVMPTFKPKNTQKIINDEL
ncbi:esterase E4-like [Planococcus citri]|uniref:esterase E4-like n=1 Tax=Planococcus citri TaxID=170843 RepID=UPI0031F7A7F7